MFAVILSAGIGAAQLISAFSHGSGLPGRPTNSSTPIPGGPTNELTPTPTPSHSLTPTPSRSPSATATVTETVTATVTKGPVAVPTALTIHVVNGNGGFDLPGWLVSLGGFLGGAGGVGTFVLAARRNDRTKNSVAASEDSTSSWEYIPVPDRTNSGEAKHKGRRRGTQPTRAAMSTPSDPGRKDQQQPPKETAKAARPPTDHSQWMRPPEDSEPGIS